MNQLNKLTLAEQIYEIIKGDILSGKIEQGSKLTLKAMQERFEVSSTPAREALSKIVEDGLADYYTNIGINVIKLDENDVREIFELLGDLDSLAIRYSFSHPNQETLLDTLEQNLKSSSMYFNQHRMSFAEKENWRELSEGFHNIFYDFCDNAKLRSMAGKLKLQMKIFANKYESLPEVQKELEDIHQEIYSAYVAGNVDKACSLMKECLNQSMQYAFHFIKK